MATCQTSKLQKKNVYKEKAKQKKNNLIEIKICIHFMRYLIIWGSYRSYVSTWTRLSALYEQEPEHFTNKYKSYPVELSVFFFFFSLHCASSVYIFVN